MLAITYTPEDLRLLEAAEIAEESPQYDQRRLGGCGSPACMLGGYIWRNAERGATLMFANACMVEFGITFEEYKLLFNSDGCDDAGTDGKKAAAYVRRFVRERAEARLR
jgi:hypothetical protein